MDPKTHISEHRILELLDYVKAPEIPVFNVLELGVERGVEVARIVALVHHDRP
ncbi:MAG: hypothetical protein KF905_06890 [Flavobacteriales bacterium]|nr:hypothetical protein [Flavobacteriales bacterium]